jgi:hypothetical protein
MSSCILETLRLHASMFHPQDPVDHLRGMNDIILSCNKRRLVSTTIHFHQILAFSLSLPYTLTNQHVTNIDGLRVTQTRTNLGTKDN